MHLLCMNGDDSLGVLLDFVFRSPEKHTYFRETVPYQRTLSAAKSDLAETVAVTEWKEKAEI